MTWCLMVNNPRDHPWHAHTGKQQHQPAVPTNVLTLAVVRHRLEHRRHVQEAPALSYHQLKPDCEAGQTHGNEHTEPGPLAADPAGDE
jgi:hypothetical protein